MRKELNNIQALRFISSFGVVVAHIPLVRYAAQGVRADVVTIGGIGVDIFFVISGFLMCYVTEATRPGFQSASAFLLKRILRIAPVYWIFTAIALWLSYLSVNCPSWFTSCPFWLAPNYNIANFDPGLILRSLTFTFFYESPIYPVAWTLVFEAWFYVLMAFSIASDFNRLKLMGTLIVGIAVLVMSGHDFSIGTAVGTLFNPLMLEFPMGMALYYFWRNGRLRWTWLAALFLASVVAYTYLETFPASPSVLNRPFTWGLMSVPIVGAALMLEGKFKVPRLALYFGSISYSLYLAHWLVMTTVPSLFDLYGITLSPLAFSLALGVISVLAAMLFYHLAEAPLAKLSKALVNGPSQRPALAKNPANQ